MGTISELAEREGTVYLKYFLPNLGAAINLTRRNRVFDPFRPLRPGTPGPVCPLCAFLSMWSMRQSFSNPGQQREKVLLVPQLSAAHLCFLPARRHPTSPLPSCSAIRGLISASAEGLHRQNPNPHRACWANVRHAFSLLSALKPPCLSPGFSVTNWYCTGPFRLLQRYRHEIIFVLTLSTLPSGVLRVYLVGFHPPSTISGSHRLGLAARLQPSTRTPARLPSLAGNSTRHPSADSLTGSLLHDVACLAWLVLPAAIHIPRQSRASDIPNAAPRCCSDRQTPPTGTQSSPLPKFPSIKRLSWRQKKFFFRLALSHG